GYLIRLSITLVFVYVEFKVLAALFYARQKEKENDKLRLANMSMELELLKAQLNPHFFFNALSSLSAVVREDPQKAQEYISHLSKIFRYSLHKPAQALVSLKEELEEVVSFCELMKMRHEHGFVLMLDVDDCYHAQQLPHMSLQPLVENALKHNIATPDKPLTVSIIAGSHGVAVCNNLQPKLFSMPGIGIGLANLNERFRILLQKEIAVSNAGDRFTVKLPFR
ncbi:MAG: histidine kinase, partial [Bacteroidetes bacterium]|nr:histidine kinase [Bacteroidota bacterium]